MKKGFTLIEMLGIIAVLAVVLLVTFPVLNNSLKTMKENQNKNFTNNLKISAEAYIELNRKNYPELDNSGSTTITIQDLYNAELLKGNYEINTSNQIIITKKQDNTLEYYYVDPTKTIVYNFDYTGAEQEFTAPLDGLYKIETWGASGGYAYDVTRSTGGGGYGGYSQGSFFLNKLEKTYINVGGAGESNCDTKSCDGGYNGGSTSGKWANADGSGLYTGGGGGATHIALDSGLLSSLELNKNNNRILIVSGGGGGGDYFPDWNTTSSGGSGGGISGGGGYNDYNATYFETYGTQTTGYGFGIAGSTRNWDSYGGSGGGYYGGISTRHHGTGTGGSGYIGNTLLTNKSMYCYDCEESNEISTFTVSTTGDSPLKDTTNCPDGYSESPIAKCAKAGNGYARITYLGSAM